MSTIIRSGSANTYGASLRNILLRQTDLSNLQNKLTSGKKIVQPSDDPIGAANAERAMTRISRVATDQRALESQSNAITQAESSLGDATDALQRFRELAVNAGNGVNSTAERLSIVNEMKGLRDQIFAIANQKDTNGLPFFGALGSALTPFVSPQQAGTSDYTFDGLPGQTASTAISIPFTLDGNSAFTLTPIESYSVAVNPVTTSTLAAGAITVSNASGLTGDTYMVTVTAVDTTTSPGNTILKYDVSGNLSGTTHQTSIPYPTGGTVAINGMSGLSMTVSGDPVAGDSVKVTPGPSVSLFNVLDTAIQNIGNAPDSNTASQAVSQALGNIDIGMERVSAVRSQAGELLNRADRISTNQEKRSTQLEADRSRAEDLDMVSAISEFQNKQTGYSAALQSYAQVQKLSLFNFIS